MKPYSQSPTTNYQLLLADQDYLLSSRTGIYIYQRLFSDQDHLLSPRTGIYLIQACEGYTNLLLINHTKQKNQMMSKYHPHAKFGDKQETFVIAKIINQLTSFNLPSIIINNKQNHMIISL